MCKFAKGDIVQAPSSAIFQIEEVHGDERYTIVTVPYPKLGWYGRGIRHKEFSFKNCDWSLVEKAKHDCKFKVGDKIYNAVCGSPSSPATVTAICFNGYTHYPNEYKIAYKYDDDGYNSHDRECNIEFMPFAAAPKVGDLVLFTNPVLGNKTYAIIDREHSYGVDYTAIESDNTDIECGTRFGLSPSQYKFVEVMVAAEDFCNCCGQYKG